MFKDILLPLPSFPRALTRPALRRALEIPAQLGAHVTGLVDEPILPTPVARHPFGIRLEQDLGARQKEVHAAAAAQLEAFEEEAARSGLSREGRLVATSGGSAHGPVVELARVRDLTVVPFLDNDGASSELVQALVFESGRPVLVMPQDDGIRFGFDTVMVAWDFGRAAARALGDALPLLQRAKAVRIVTVTSDKPMPDDTSGRELLAHLARNGVEATFEEIGRGRRGVGEALEEAASGADLMVMGAFGHSRIRDFFLGGATAHVLETPRLPTLLSQ